MTISICITSLCQPLSEMIERWPHSLTHSHQPASLPRPVDGLSIPINPRVCAYVCGKSDKEPSAQLTANPIQWHRAHNFRCYARAHTVYLHKGETERNEAQKKKNISLITSSIDFVHSHIFASVFFSRCFVGCQPGNTFVHSIFLYSISLSLSFSFFPTRSLISCVLRWYPRATHIPWHVECALRAFPIHLVCTLPMRIFLLLSGWIAYVTAGYVYDCVSARVSLCVYCICEKEMYIIQRTFFFRWDSHPAQVDSIWLNEEKSSTSERDNA